MKISVPLGLVLVTVASLPARAAEHRTPNFLVIARSRDVAQQVGEYAEYYRQQKGVEWLGFELPTWETPCEIDVRLTFGGAGGATSFTFDRGAVLGQSMTVEGPLDRILNSVLPHEITHTIFAARFRRPLPRWADEGGAVLSEDYQELARHDLLVRKLINSGRMIPLERLFVLTEYPRDVMALYAQGFSVANYLVSLRGRSAFLDFVADGQQSDWESAAARHFGYRSIAELEQAWIDWLIVGRGTGADLPVFAEVTRPANRPSAMANSTRLHEPVGSLYRRTPEIASQSAHPAPEMAPTIPNGRIARVEPTWARDDAPRSRSPAIQEPRAIPVSQPPSAADPREDTKSSAIASTTDPEASSPSTTTSASSPRRRIIPIAVGRTRRSHVPPINSNP